ncbi:MULTISPECIES: hypothetical protein [Sulfitobacter]|uniref:hypothetical protein n=1 Tax=Sulfitobacter TaxID=60136 RepID=UPI002456E31E|nr:hypothetical protein [Sulfitobacter faviae]MDH4541088.1 hypothetical protein [Sulfitobacter faviae]
MSDFASEDEIREIFGSALDGDAGFELQVLELDSEGDGPLPLYVLKHPWNDPTLVLAVPSKVDDAQAFSEVLERIELPEKYSGIYHKKTSALEIFWTAYKVRKKHEEVAVRSFDIWWKGAKRKCRFGPASDEAKTLAKYTLPQAAASHTEHRNIMSFHYFVHDADHSNMGEPICFWVDCEGIEPCDFDEYLRTINFYMTYYDRETPRVLIHEAGPKDTGNFRPRYVDENFPRELVAGDIDPSVSSFWLGAFETRDPAMKFLLHYRLLEFLSLAHMKSEQRRELINVLRRPHLISSTETAAAEIAGLFSGQARETDRIKNFIDETVRTEKVWSVLEMNKAVFCKETVFDGGFRVKAVLNDSTNLEGWTRSGPISLVDRLRAIRNCLAHGQDEGTRGVIHTTQKNKVVLMPWVNLIETFAAEAMLYARRTYVPGETK